MSTRSETCNAHPQPDQGGSGFRNIGGKLAITTPAQSSRSKDSHSRSPKEASTL
jgi:hypothetical protein